MEITATNWRQTEAWRLLFREHRRKNNFACACGWNGKEDEEWVEYEHHLAAVATFNMRHVEGKLTDILRNLFEFERRGAPLRDPHYVLTFRSNQSISTSARGLTAFGAQIDVVYFDDRGQFPVADLMHNGHRWTVVPKAKTAHMEVLKLRERIGKDVWEEPEVK